MKGFVDPENPFVSSVHEWPFISTLLVVVPEKRLVPGRPPGQLPTGIRWLAVAYYAVNFCQGFSEDRGDNVPTGPETSTFEILTRSIKCRAPRALPNRAAGGHVHKPGMHQTFPFDVEFPT